MTTDIDRSSSAVRCRERTPIGRKTAEGQTLADVLAAPSFYCPVMGVDYYITLGRTLGGRPGIV
jgi:hypothetical protein